MTFFGEIYAKIEAGLPGRSGQLCGQLWRVLSYNNCGYTLGLGEDSEDFLLDLTVFRKFFRCYFSQAMVAY